MRHCLHVISRSIQVVKLTRSFGAPVCDGRVRRARSVVARSCAGGRSAWRSLPCEAMSSAPRDEWPASSAADAERLRAVTDALVAIAADRSLLGALTVEERTRLLRAAGDVYEPDLVQRRRWGKAVRRNEKAAKARRDEAVLADTGIRVLREKPVFTTPNVFPPEAFEQHEVDGRPDVSRGGRAAALLRLQAALRRRPPLLRPAVPGLRRLQLRQAHRDRRPDGPRRAAHRRAREDRLPGGDQAAARRRRADRHDALPARRGGPLRGRSPTSSDWRDRLEIYGLDLRHTPSVEAFCHHLLDHPRPARLHRQQRLPDGAAAAGFYRT